MSIRLTGGIRATIVATVNKKIESAFADSPLGKEVLSIRAEVTEAFKKAVSIVCPVGHLTILKKYNTTNCVRRIPYNSEQFTFPPNGFGRKMIMLSEYVIVPPNRSKELYDAFCNLYTEEEQRRILETHYTYTCELQKQTGYFQGIINDKSVTTSKTLLTKYPELAAFIDVETIDLYGRKGANHATVENKQRKVPSFVSDLVAEVTKAQADSQQPSQAQPGQA